MIREIMDAHAANLNRQWSHDRSQTVGASDIGQCARKTYWTKHANDPKHAATPDNDYTDGWGARVRGTIIENAFWEPAMRARYGDKLKFAGTEQRTFVSGFLSATPDGLVIDQPDDALSELGVAHLGGGCFMTECKSSDPRTNLTEAKAENVYQTQVQLGLVRELTQWKPEFSVLSYIDASFWNEVKEFLIPFDPKIFEVAKQRARQIMTAKSFIELKPEGWITGGRECEYCPFTRACNVERRSVPEKAVIADHGFVAEVTELALAIVGFEDTINDNNVLMRELQNEMREKLRAKSVRKIPNVVTWSSVKGRSGYDNKALREAAIEAGVDVEQFATTGEPTDRLIISCRKPEEEKDKHTSKREKNWPRNKPTGEESS